MKFTRACQIAASLGSVAYVAEAQSLSTVFDIFSSGMLNNQDFYKNLLLTLQRDSGNTTTDCMKGYSDF